MKRNVFPSEVRTARQERRLPGFMGAGRQGFTLIEVLVALVITAIVLAGVYATFSAVMDTRRRVEAGSGMDMAARLVLTRISREIQSAFLVKRSADAPPESRYTIFAGSQEEVAGQPGDKISFSTFAHTKRGVDADESDQTVVAYEVEENEAAPEVSGGAGADRRSNDGERTLLRREWRRIPPPGETQHSKPRAIALVDDIQGFRVRFRDDEGEWTDHWDSTEVRTLDLLPAAVEITLTLRDGNGRNHDFVTVAAPKISPFDREGAATGEQGTQTTAPPDENAPTGQTGGPTKTPVTGTPLPSPGIPR